MEEIALTPEQEAEAERIEDVLLAGMRSEARRISRLLASKENSQLFGATEFRIRDRCHRLGARAIDAALNERKKRGTEVPRRRVPAVGGD